MVLKTERDYDDPSVTQLSVFLQNRVGELRDVLRHLDGAAVGVHAVSVDDSIDYAVVRLIVDQCELAVRTLKAAGFTVTETTLLAIELPDERSGLLAICRALIQAEINIAYIYPMFTRPRGHGVVVVHVDALPTAALLLKKHGFSLLDERELVHGA